MRNTICSIIVHMKKYNRAIFILSIIGIVIAVYVLQSFLRQTSIVCLNSGCEVVRKSSYSYIFGIPVPTFGLVGYSLLLILSILKTMSSKKWIVTGMLGIASCGVLFVSWFTYTELFIIKAICTWCAVSAINMVVLWILTCKTYFTKGLYAHNE